MLALESLKIPLPVRHPLSPCLSNASSTPRILWEYKNLSCLQCFGEARSFFMERGRKTFLDALIVGCRVAEKAFCIAFRIKLQNRVMTRPRITICNVRKLYLKVVKWKHTVKEILFFKKMNGGFAENMSVTEDVENDIEKSKEKLVRRHQKSVADFSRTQEVLLKDCGFSMIKGKGLAQRQKTSSRTALTSDAELSGLNPIPFANAESHLANGFSRVRKSSRTPSLQDEENSRSSSFWPTSKWSFKSDCQARFIAPAPRTNSTNWKKKLQLTSSGSAITFL